MNGKIFNLKKCLSLDEASVYLSSAFEEKVTVADICRLVLDRQLTLSVRFNSYIEISPGHLLDESSLPYTSNATNTFVLNLTQRLFFEDGAMLSEGVWDLTMFGGEVLCVEELLSFEEGTPAWRASAAESIILKRNSVFGKLKAISSKLGTSANIIGKETKLDPREARVDCKTLDYYDHELVVRKSEIDRFVLSVQGEKLPEPPVILEEKTLASRERNTLLTVIGALCHQLDIDPSARGVSSAVQRMTELVGVSISDDSIRKILSEVEPALERRQK